MKKRTRVITLFIVLLLIWNVILTAIIVNNNSKQESITDINQTTVTGFSTDLTKVFEENKSSVVTVEAMGNISSGIIYKTSDDAVYVVTTFHGVAADNFLHVIFDSGATYEASVEGYDSFGDIAVLKVETNLQVTPVKLGNSDLLNDGEFLACIGTPKSIEYASSDELAIVSSSLRTILNSVEFNEDTYEYYQSAIQLSSNVKEGYSGSPIFNMAGEVQGLITMKDDTAVFALPINEVKIIADNIIEGVEYSKIQFGFKPLVIADLESYQKNELNIPLDVNNGLYISNVLSSSLANSLGIKSGDIIESINERSINKYSDLLEVEYTDTRSFEIKVVRDNEEISLKGSIND